jgi:phosphoribosylformylglycinamidine synthase
MLWQVEVLPRNHDVERLRVAHEFDLLTHSLRGQDLLASSSHGYLIEEDVASEQQQQTLANLLVDPVVEFVSVGPLNANHTPYWLDRMITVLLKPGVMDPAAQSVIETCRDLGLAVQSVRTYRRYFTVEPLDDEDRPVLFRKVLANDAIEQIVEGPLTLDHLSIGTPYHFRRVVVPLRGLDEDGLVKLSREGQLALNLAEMKSIQAHVRKLDRDPTDVELETFAQTWSEHCSHKTLKGQIDFEGRTIENLLKQTIFGSTQEIRRRLGADDWCVSVFDDNAGVVRFNDEYHVCFKVETHNHPSAIEPYGGASTGLGGVIRDVLGTALGAKPVCNTDVFCFAPPDSSPEQLPPGVLHPRKVMQGVVAGVRDYGNRMGIPTVNGAVCFDERYLANPLVYCGTVGLLPVNRAHKEAQPNDLIVAVGGRTGRDGIHGATFSSLELDATSEKVSGGAVQIGNAITEKKMLDVLLQARDQELFSAITDCGAGGFSSAVGEMGADLGAEVHLERAPLKYDGLSYTEIWISESQERMVLAVPEANWAALQALCAREDVEAVVLGRYVPTGRLKLCYHGEEVADLDMHFLHKGRPAVVRPAALPTVEARPRTPTPQGINYTDVLKSLLGSLNVCSKEWIVRQYDHEVQGGTVVKPLVGAVMDGPGDAAVITPVLGSTLGLAIGCGIQPRYGDLDPYAMAAAAIDEAVRNVVAVGADPSRIALLDNFCWGNTDRAEVLGSLVRAAEACRDVALAYMMPFISGKDSLNNEYRSGNTRIAIPPTLLISALGRVPDVRQCVTMDLKQAGNALFLIGTTREELGGSHYHLVTGGRGGMVPAVDLELAPRIFRQLHAAIQAGLVRACHDLSEGGLAVAVAEMAFAGGVGVDVTHTGGLVDDVFLFSESATRFLVEVTPGDAREFQELMSDLPCMRVGQTTRDPRLRIAGAEGEWVVWAPLDELKEAWQKPLRW